VPWFRLDDSFHSHPKVIAAGNEAIGLYVRCGTYAAQHLTDGFIRQDVALLYGSDELIDTLVKTTLWRRVRGGWLMPDYLDYNPSAEQVKQDRKNAAERQRRRRDTIMSRRDSPRDSRVSHTTPTRPVKEPPNPPPSGGHDGSHPNCRACGTNPRGPTPPPVPTPTPPPVADVLGTNGQAIRGRHVAAIAAEARKAITRKDDH
jgi:hypothetical protein